MAIYGIGNDAWETRILAIPGDLAKPEFGMGSDEFLSLGKGVGGILHNGAYLSQMASYSQLAATNVQGTRQMLKIAAKNGGIPFQMISSVAVFEASEYRNKDITENDDISSWEGIYNGYSQTKWVSERLVIKAGRKGLPITVYRPPLIAGDSRTGAWHKDDLLYRLMKGCLELGMVPDIPWELDLVPVDYVANAVTALAWQPDSLGRNFHLHHPHPLLLKDYIARLAEIGASFEIVSMQKWLDCIQSNPSNPLYDMSAFFTRRWGPEQLTYPELNQSGLRSRPSTALTVEALNKHGICCPSFEDLIAPYSAALIQGGVS
jgi:thioester reductase-like protein